MIASKDNNRGDREEQEPKIEKEETERNCDRKEKKGRMRKNNHK